GDREVRLGRVALGEEEVERIDLPDLEPEEAGHRVHVDLALQRPVHAAEIDAELAVDEHPEIVVAREREHLTALVLELRVELQGEVVIVSVALVAPALIVDREEGVVGVLIEARLNLGELDRDLEVLVDASDVVVPLVEIGGAGGRGCGRVAGVDRLVVRAEVDLDDAGILADCVLEVGVGDLEVANRRVERGAAQIGIAVAVAGLIAVAVAVTGLITVAVAGLITVAVAGLITVAVAGLIAVAVTGLIA